MRKFQLTEVKKAYQVWHYEIEAETEEKALELFESGDLEPVDYDVWSEPDTESEVEIDEVNQ